MKFFKDIKEKFLSVVPAILIVGAICTLIGDSMLEASSELIALFWVLLVFTGASFSFLWSGWDKKR